MSQQYFHFTIGPVQGFVAQARRTRDFWAGSFILSWLSAVAIKAVKKQGGEILFPHPNEKFLGAVTHGGKGPKQGSIPNRFKAEVHAKDFDPDKVTKAVQGAWKALADKVWAEDLKDIAGHGNSTKDIWDRQIKHFWDIEWVLVPEKNAHDESTDNTLDRLKNWRTYMPPDEPGVKCMMMEGWQELSGAERPGKQPRAFWEAVREQDKTGIKSDLRDGEMLCAIAFVKRRFVRYFEGKYELSDFAVHGWDLPSGVPSVDYLAAAHWLEKLIEKTAQDADLKLAFWQFHDAAHKLTDRYGEWESNIRCIRQAVGKHGGHKKWEALDGEVFFESVLENKRLWKPKEDEAKGLANQLRGLQKIADVKAATPFYAVLLMDGDELGIHMSDVSKQKAISGSLAKFTKGVGEIVDEHSGFLIYAGGDDVLAILPMEDALRCATELRRHYCQAFAATNIPSSLSGAIEYAHVKTPLGKILKDAHDLLDNVAKEKYGRDSIACRVWNNAGMMLQWAMPWRCALDDACFCIIDQQATRFRKQFAKQEPSLASGFFYRIRELLQFSLADSGEENRRFGTELLASTLLNSGLVDKNWNQQKAESFLEPLLSQCYPRIRDKDKAPDQWPMAEPNADAAMLVRFLAMKGME